MVSIKNLIQTSWAKLLAPLQLLPGNVRGAIYIMTAGIIFTLAAAFIKELGGEISVFQILLIRQATMTISVLPVIARNFPDALRTKSLPLQIVRVMFAIIAMVGSFLAIQHMPMADATALSFAKSLFVTIFAIIFLKEIAGVNRWLATLVGFAGVLVIVQPETSGVDIYALYAVAGAAGAAMVSIIIRHLSQFDRSITILSYQALLVGAAMLPFGIYFWVWPTLLQWAMMLGIGFLSVAGQFCNIAGYRAGEASAVAPLDYARLVFAALIGFFVFLEVPTWSTILGSCIIIGTSIYSLRSEQRRSLNTKSA
jgi:drug/metabolite transporter (DMT)-like permease